MGGRLGIPPHPNKRDKQGGKDEEEEEETGEIRVSGAGAEPGVMVVSGRKAKREVIKGVQVGIVVPQKK